MMRTLTALLAAMALSACATTAPAPTRVDTATAAALDAENAAFSAAFVRGDVEAILAAYTADAVVQTPQGTVASTPETIRMLWAPIERGDDRISHSLRSTLRQRLAPHLVLEQGAFTIVRRVDNAEQRSDGCYTLIWRHSDGRWRIQFDSWTPPHNPARSCTAR
jgi:ketosteroid isomerase-like protein